MQKGFYTKLRGVTGQNGDGTNRQTLLSCLTPGEILDIRYYPTSGAIAVFNSKQHTLGFLSGQLQDELHTWLTIGASLKANVAEITGMQQDYLGCNIFVECTLNGSPCIPERKKEK